MFLSLFAKRLTSRMNSTLMHAAMRLYAGDACNKDCPKTYPCIIEYPKKKCKEPECLPKETCCPVPFSKCPAVKEDACKPRLECCGSKRLSRDPCNCKDARLQNEKKDLKLNRNILPKKSVWEWPAACCGNPCSDMLPRFDTMYYCPTDKAKRQYQQTWVECPPVQIKQRKVCCFDSTELPPICRRQKKECPLTACEFDSPKLRELCCLNAAKNCPRIRMPCCRISRVPPLCKNAREPTDCKKQCCPYPSFSECCQPCPAPKKPSECKCLDRSPQCILNKYLSYKQVYDLPPLLPAWPPKMIGPY